MTFTCLQLVFIASYLFLRWKRRKEILTSLGISVAVVAASIVASVVLYWLIYAFVCIFEEVVGRNTIAGMTFLLVIIVLVVDSVVYGVNKFRKYRYEQTKRKLSKLLML